MASFKTHEFKYNKPKGGPDEADDITVVFGAQVDVVGVDGVAPNDPGAGFAVDGDGTGVIKIRDIKKADGETLKLRVKGRGRKAPGITRAFWTIEGKPIANALTLLSASAIDAEIDPVTAAVDTFEPVLLEMRDLSERFQLLTRSRFPVDTLRAG